MDWLTGGNDLVNTAFGWGLDMFGGKIASDESYDKTRRLQKHNFEFQREMFQKQLDADNTALQRRMADADEAGLNANLLFGAGSSGASTPSAGSGGAGSVSMEAPSGTTALQFAMAKERQDAEIDALKKQTEADVDLKNAQAALAMKQAGYTEQEIKFFLEHGVPAGTTNTTSTNSSGPFGLWNVGRTDTTAIGWRQNKNNKNPFGRAYDGLPLPPKGMSRWEYNRWLKANGYKIPR